MLIVSIAVVVDNFLYIDGGEYSLSGGGGVTSSMFT